MNNIFYLSTISAIWLRTWLCLQVYRLWGKPILHPINMCLSVVECCQRGHNGSVSLIQVLWWWKHAIGCSNWEADITPSISQISLHVSFLYSTFSQFVHCLVKSPLLIALTLLSFKFLLPGTFFYRQVLYFANFVFFATQTLLCHVEGFRLPLELHRTPSTSFLFQVFGPLSGSQYPETVLKLFQV